MSVDPKENPGTFHVDGHLPAGSIAPPEVLDGPITLVPYDPTWPQLYEREVARIRDVLGDRVLQIEHVGSTSVPNLAAKPRIDILLVVADSVDEESYVIPLEAEGYILRIREPHWYQHRMFNGPDAPVNLHVFSPNCPETERMLRFRDWLRAHEAERHLYERTKRELAARRWKYTQQYADAKSAVVEEILQRAQASDGANPKD